MSDKSIPLDAVRNALMCAMVKKIARTDREGRPLGRVAAYTYYAPLTSVACESRWRGGARRTFPGMHFGPMWRGDLDRVIQRVRVERGVAEVRRTWGAGVRALKAEAASGVMR